MTTVRIDNGGVRWSATLPSEPLPLLDLGKDLRISTDDSVHDWLWRVPIQPLPPRWLRVREHHDPYVHPLRHGVQWRIDGYWLAVRTNPSMTITTNGQLFVLSHLS